MTEALNYVIAHLNAWGAPFCQYAWAMLIQSSFLIGALLVADALLRHRVRAVVRYGLWLLLLVKLMLPPSLTSPVSIRTLVDEYWTMHPPIATTTKTPALGSVMLSAADSQSAVAPLPSVSPERDAVTLPVDGIGEGGISISMPLRMLPLHWQGSLLIWWALGVLALGGMLLQRGLLCLRLLGRAQPATGNLAELLGECCATMGLDRRKVRLKVAAEMTSPAVCGILRPTILMPAYLITKLSSDQMRMVLAHELAHIKRRDLLVNLAQTILQIVYFYNPLLWLANGIVRRAREQAVDETVLVMLGRDAADYSHTLIDIAEQAFHRPALSLRLIGVVESKTALAERIRHVLTNPLPRSAKLGIAGMMSIVLVGVLLLPMAKGKNSGNNAPAPVSTKASVQKVANGQLNNETNAPIKGDIQTNRYLLSGRVIDSSGNPVPEVEVIVGDWLESQTQFTVQTRTINTDRNGNFAFREQFAPFGKRRWIYVRKDGYGFSGCWHNASGAETNVTIELFPAVTIKGRVTDSAGQPIVGAEIAFLLFERPDLRPRIRIWCPFQDAGFVPRTKTTDDGSFILEGAPGSGKVSIRVTSSGYESVIIRDIVTTKNEAMWINHKMHQFGEPLNVVLRQGATLRGSVVREDTGASVTGLCVAIQSHDSGSGQWQASITDGKGQFEFINVTPEPLNVLAKFDKTPEKGPHEWTAAALEIKKLKPGETRERLKIVATKGGIVKGHVRDSEGKPLAGIGVGFYSAAYPRSGAAMEHTDTDEDGAWSYRLPAGPVYAYIYSGNSKSFQPNSYDLDLKKDRIIEHIDFQCASNNLVGPSSYNPFMQSTADPLAKPTVPALPSNSLSGQVVNSNGAPVEGVRVDNPWSYGRQPPVRTDTNGMFSVTNLDQRNKTVAIRFSKADYSPIIIQKQPVGKMCEPVMLTRNTYFEGSVTNPKGQCVIGGIIRAMQSPKGPFMEIPTETVTDDQGKYRLYVQPDIYDIQVKVPTAGVARLRDVRINQDEAKRLDIALTTGVVFRAQVLDSMTQKPVTGIAIETAYQHENKGQSNTNGLIEIAGLMPGPCDFSVKATGYTRWWSQQCIKERERFYVAEGIESAGLQRNFDSLSFDLIADMMPVTIMVECGARIRGKVLDPDGNPVAYATVAPALTGTGNSLTGDTRFSVRTRENGAFEMLLPASKTCEYNLVAHDGDFGKWRKWANGVTPPFRTDPGQNIDDMIIRLSKPGVVKGTVVDREGKPVADREVQAADFDKFENRYYLPTISTDKDGRFELGFVRPGKHYIQVAPFHTPPEYAPIITSRIVAVEAGKTVDNVRLMTVPE